MRMSDALLRTAGVTSNSVNTPVPFGRIDWTTLRRLDFEAPDPTTFRCLALAYAAADACRVLTTRLTGDPAPISQ